MPRKRAGTGFVYTGRFLGRRVDVGSLMDMGISARAAFLALLGALVQAVLAVVLRQLRPDDWLPILSSATVFVTPLYAWICMRPIAARAKELADHAREAAQGEHSMVERVEWNDELGDAEGAYNRLLTSFKMRESKLQVARDGARITTQKLERKAAELELLYDISVGLRDIYEPSSALALCLDKAVEVLECEWAAYLMWDSQTSTYTMESIRGFTTEMTAEVRMALWRGNSFPESATLSAQVSAGNEPLFSHSLAKGRKFRDFAEFRDITQPVSAFMGIPVVNRQGLSDGVLLTVNRRDSQNFSKGDADMGREISRLIFLALDKTRSFQKGFREAGTGLFVREYLSQRLAEEIRLSGRDSREVTVVAFGIDDPDSIMARGEQFMETFSQAMGKIILDVARTVDIPCRLSGTTFAVLLPDTSLRGAMVFGSRLLEAVASGPISGRDNPDLQSRQAGIHSTLSVGIRTATYAQLAGSDNESLLRDAIETMEKARSQGGNRLLCSEGRIFVSNRDSADYVGIEGNPVVNLDAGGTGLAGKSFFLNESLNGSLEKSLEESMVEDSSQNTDK
jgi:diguanylate cyclase (GGDEF)-like protein